MANTYSYTGKLSISALLKVAISGDQSGSAAASVSKTDTFAASGGDATLTGFVYGTVTCAAGDWLLAHASDPFGSMGDATYSQGFTVAGSKLKLLYIENTDPTNSITIARKSSNGLPIFDAASDSVTLGPGDVLLITKLAGTSALTTTSNDGLTISVSAGSPVAKVLVGYGA